jgi:hypothetical protein
MEFKIINAAIKTALLGALVASVFNGQASASALDSQQKAATFSSLPMAVVAAKHNKTVLAWLPGANRNSHFGECTDEEERLGGCETKTNNTTGASWCSCPQEQGEN